MLPDKWYHRVGGDSMCKNKFKERNNIFPFESLLAKKASFKIVARPFSFTLSYSLSSIIFTYDYSVFNPYGYSYCQYDTLVAAMFLFTHFQTRFLRKRRFKRRNVIPFFRLIYIRRITTSPMVPVR